MIRSMIEGLMGDIIMKYIFEDARKFVAIKKWRDGGETVIEYFRTREQASKWIQKQRNCDDYVWCIGEFE